MRHRDIPPLVAVRIEAELHRFLASCDDFFGRVAWVSDKGFYIVTESGHVVCFHGHRTLYFPFSVATLPDAGAWSRTVSLAADDEYEKHGMTLLRKGTHLAVIDLSDPELVQLDRSPFLTPPSGVALSNWIRRLSGPLRAANPAEGLAGVLSLLPSFQPTHLLEKEGRSSLARYASRTVTTLVAAAAARDVAEFCEPWNDLVGLGQGATPSGDDLLTGFLAAHSLLHSSFWGLFKGSSDGPKLRETASKSTTVLAAAMIASALDGVFPEPIVQVFEELGSDDGRAERTVMRIMKLGHTSGSDLMTGVILGLESMRLAGI